MMVDHEDGSLSRLGLSAFSKASVEEGADAAEAVLMVDGHLGMQFLRDGKWGVIEVCKAAALLLLAEPCAELAELFGGFNSGKDVLLLKLIFDTEDFVETRVVVAAFEERITDLAPVRSE